MIWEKTAKYLNQCSKNELCLKTVELYKKLPGGGALDRKQTGGAAQNRPNFFSGEKDTLTGTNVENFIPLHGVKMRNI